MDNLKAGRHKPESSLYVLFSCTLIIVPPLAYFVSFFLYSVNVPVNDDYKAILQFLNTYLQLPGLAEKLSLVFSQHNEHRIAYIRLWALLDHAVTGKVNFNILSFIGNSTLLVIAFMFYTRFKKNGLTLAWFAPVSVLLFNLSLWENMTFAMAALSNFTVFIFLMLSLYCLTHDIIKPLHFISALLSMLVAVFCNGSGIFLAPVSLIILLYKKQYRYAIIHILFSAILLAFYFYKYAEPLQHPDIMSTLTDHKVKALLFMFAFLGSAFNYFLIYTNNQDESVRLAMVIGFGLFALFLYITKTGYYKKNPFMFSLMLLMVTIAFVTAVSRCQLGLDTSGASRYRINSVIFLITIYFWFIETVSLKGKGALLTLLTVFYFFYISLNQYEYLVFRKQASLLGALYYHSGNYKQLNGFEQEEYNRILAESKGKGTYELPSATSLEHYFPYSAIIGSEGPAPSTGGLRCSIDNIEKINGSYLIDGWAFIESMPAGDQKVFIALDADSAGPVLFSAKQIPRFDLNPYFHKYNLRNAGYFARIRSADVTPGRHKISIKVINGSQTRIISTGRELVQ